MEHLKKLIAAALVLTAMTAGLATANPEPASAGNKIDAVTCVSKLYAAGYSSTAVKVAAQARSFNAAIKTGSAARKASAMSGLVNLLEDATIGDCRSLLKQAAALAYSSKPAREFRKLYPKAGRAQVPQNSCGTFDLWCRAMWSRGWPSGGVSR